MIWPEVTGRVYPVCSERCSTCCGGSPPDEKRGGTRFGAAASAQYVVQPETQESMYLSMFR